MIKCLSIFLVPSRSSSTPFYPQSVASQRACPNSLFFRCFHFKLTFESIKELGGVLQTLPKDKKKIGCKWVYKIKHNVNGFMSKYKARLVAKGYVQTYSINYEETYSPIAKMTIAKIIIAMAKTKGWSLHQMDVKKCISAWRFTRRSVHGTTTRLCGPNTT